MEEEISLTEIFITIWHGRYIILAITALATIIALLASLLLITPKYEAQAAVDLTPYEIDSSRLISSIRKDNHLESALTGLTENPLALAEQVTISENGGQVEITVSSPGPDLAAAAANQVKLYIFDQATDELYRERETLQDWLAFFDQQLADRYQEIFALDNMEELQNDPAYIYLMEEKGRRLVQLHEAEYKLHRLEANKEKYQEEMLNAASVPTEPYNVRWQLNTAVAFVLGLMLSVMVVFIKPYIGELTKEVRAAKDNPES